MMEELKEKEVKLKNAEKLKVMRFGKRGGKGRKGKWKKDGIEEVEEYKYLGFIFQRNRGIEAHLKERMRKAADVMREIWEIGKK